MEIDQSIFKAYDIRGIYPEVLDEKVAYAIGVGYAKFLKPQSVIVGRDVRLSGKKLMDAFIVGLQSENIDVTEIDDMITTELIYFASGFYDFDGAVSVTASHNPREYNGFKMCRRNAETISGDTGIKDIRDLALQVDVPDVLPAKKPTQKQDIFSDYFKYLHDHFVVSKINQFSIVGDGNFGMQATVLKEFVRQYKLPLELSFINEEPDGSFPKGRPDPMIPDNREQMTIAIREGQYDFGVAWDADADRCFFYDEDGGYIDPYYINGLFIDYVLNQNSKYKILHDPRLKWLPIDVGQKYKNEIIFDKSGSAFMKLKMIKEKIYFGAEVTAHYFFQDFFNSDSGLIPLLWVMQILSAKKQSLSELVRNYKTHYPKVDEMLFKVNSVADVLEKIKKVYKAGQLETLDGISYEFTGNRNMDWRFNARGSNTEPLLKINLEGRSIEIIEQKQKEIIDLIKGLGGQKVDN